ncbi:DMT family transporter [Erythrobacter crassostreae]|uniref:DMT family transporter n=1 Tax=Erythrobacter crassostreae TaxID=2828328 RepID=A0A9X1JMK6_9SPHN|nr:DMT family transporter [Erythrobacter crassostrea]MBV7258833.1 DMT family transporter [Erythrobacter crassostrea]
MRSTAVTVLMATLAIIAFAGNSLIARAALADGAIEAGAFSAIRLAAGALVLLPFLGKMPSLRDATGAVSLAVYVAGFSLAYLSLGAAIGALILFACVQATIIAVGYWRGEGLTLLGWAGLVMAMGGLVVLLAPGGEPVEIGAAVMMATAGIAWGAYTVIGRGSGDASGSTARNFLLATPLVLPMLWLDSGVPSSHGVFLAVIAGALTSGLGYVIWYKVTPRLGFGTVASVQLATPVVTAIGGVLLLSEPLDWRLIAGGILIVGGIVLTIIKPG